MGRIQTNMEAAETLVLLKYRGHLTYGEKWSSVTDSSPSPTGRSPQAPDQWMGNTESNGNACMDRKCDHDLSTRRLSESSFSSIEYNCSTPPPSDEQTSDRLSASMLSSTSPDVNNSTHVHTSQSDLCLKSPLVEKYNTENVADKLGDMHEQAPYLAHRECYVQQRRQSFNSLSDSDENVIYPKPVPENCISPVHSPSFSISSSKNKKTASLFPKPNKERNLRDIVGMLATRHEEDYFVGWSAERVLALPYDERPLSYPVTQNLKRDLISKSVLTENKKLSFCWCSLESWGENFRRKLHDGTYKTLSDAKRDASALWREHCPGYDESRAVRMRDDKGNIVLKRTRAMAGSELEYRQGLRKAKVACMMDQIWSKRTVIHDALKLDLLHMDTLLSEIGQEVNGYVAPEDKLSQLADIIAHKLKKELASCQTDK